MTESSSQFSGRGATWSRAETMALIRFWGEAELKYAVSTLKRNYNIFLDISNSMKSCGYNREAAVCRCKTKILRRDYKKALANNNRSGCSPSTFPYFEEMQRIFRGDAGMLPLRVSDSHVCLDSVPAASQASDQETVTIDLIPMESDTSLLAGMSDERDTSHDNIDDESSLDPATRLSLLRRKKKRRSPSTEVATQMSSITTFLNKKIDETNHLLQKSDDKYEKLLRTHNETMYEVKEIFKSFCEHQKQKESQHTSPSGSRSTIKTSGINLNTTEEVVNDAAEPRKLSLARLSLFQRVSDVHRSGNISDSSETEDDLDKSSESSEIQFYNKLENPFKKKGTCQEKSLETIDEYTNSTETLAIAPTPVKQKDVARGLLNSAHISRRTPSKRRRLPAKVYTP